MIDWTASMQQTFEFYIVDPTKDAGFLDKKRLDNVKSCTINWDAEAETLGSASFEVTGSVGECYIRVYLVATQNGITEKRPLGTFLVQTPSSTFDGRVRNVTMDAYSPLTELKEKQPPIGYHIPKGSNVMNKVYDLMKEHMRTTISKPAPSLTELSYDFVADPNDTWLSFLSDLLTAAYSMVTYKVEKKYGNYVITGETLDNHDWTNTESVETDHTTTTGNKVYECRDSSKNFLFNYCVREHVTNYKISLDETGRVLFVPDQTINGSAPIWTYTDDNSSILYSEITMDHDLYGIPNVIEVIYSNGGANLTSIVKNDDDSSPTSIKNRGREIWYRVTNPDLYGTPDQKRLDDYAKQLLAALSSVEYTITYTHGYCPVRVGDCVRLSYTRAGLNNIKAKVISQSIKCEPGCPVSETAVFTTQLWGKQLL